VEDKKQKDLRRKELGRRGEDIAADLLQQMGMDVLARNVHAGKGEIDIIALQTVTAGAKVEAFVRFIEVKSRHEPMEGDPLEAVNSQKQRKIASAAKEWLSSGKCHEALHEAGFVTAGEYHFDVVTVVWNEPGDDFKTEYIPDAFYPIYT